MSALVLKEIEKTFQKDLRALDRVSLSLEPGELLVIVGPSGSGKSTLLRCIAGLEPLTGGEIFVHGKPIHSLPPQKRNMAMMFQNYALFPHLTLQENMSFGLHIRKFPSSEISSKVNLTAQKLGISSLLNRYPHEVSGGQRQRAALGRAILREPTAFLLDEPLSNLDLEIRHQMRKEIKKIHAELNIPMIYVTHDQVEALSLGHRIAIMNQGKILQVDTPEMVYTQPSCKFVAEFMGQPKMNFFKGTLVPKDGLLFLQSEDFQIPLPEMYQRSLKPYFNKKVWMGLRPEHISLLPNEDSLFLANGHIVGRENLGSQTTLEFQIPSHTILVSVTSNSPVLSNLSQNFIPSSTNLSQPSADLSSTPTQTLYYQPHHGLFFDFLSEQRIPIVF